MFEGPKFSGDPVVRDFPIIPTSPIWSLHLGPDAQSPSGHPYFAPIFRDEGSLLVACARNRIRMMI